MAKKKGNKKGGGSRARTGMEFAVSGMILAVAGVFIPAEIPKIDYNFNLGLILCFLAILLGVIAIVKNERGGGFIAIAIGLIPFIQLAIGVVIGAFGGGGMSWGVSIGLIVVAICLVIWILFIRK